MKVYKKNTGRTWRGIATVLSCTLLFSCDNDDFTGSGNPETSIASDKICFGISSDNNVQSRGYANDGYTSGRFVLRSADNPADTLCVRTVVSDGIDVSGFEGEQALSRGVPIDESNFYDKFHVQAYWTKDGDDGKYLYMDEDATKSDSFWSTGTTYYWPGEGHNLQFYAWAPTDAKGLKSTPSLQQGKTIEYEVPGYDNDPEGNDVTAQKDLMVAVTEEIKGDYNQSVPLTFSHICTAVRFAISSGMQPGTITSVALKGVYGAGTYNMDEDTWDLDKNEVYDFSQELSQTTPPVSDRVVINDGENTFMMLPQQLPEGATVEVGFEDAVSGSRTLTASIGGTEWEMGKTVTYMLSITPEYKMEITVPEDPQDAHYISFDITVNVEDYDDDGKWTLTSNSDKVFFTTEQTDLQKQGYWIDDDKGDSKISGTGNGSFTYHVYVEENVGDEARDIIFSITPDVDGVEGAIGATATVKQLCPSWNEDGLGCERIEDGEYPWGFKWDRKVTYYYQQFGALIFWYVANNYISNYNATSYADAGSWFPMNVSVTIDYSSISLNVTRSESDGLLNTKEIYFFEGIGNVSDLEKILDDMTWRGYTWTKKVEDGENNYESITNFAVKMAVMKNKFSKKLIEETASDGSTYSYYTPTIETNDIKWYLPASEEFSYLSDTDYQLDGNYWTSTAKDDNANAYYFTASGNTVSTADRMTYYKIRAVRKKDQE